MSKELDKKNPEVTKMSEGISNVKIPLRIKGTDKGYDFNALIDTGEVRYQDITPVGTGFKVSFSEGGGMAISMTSEFPVGSNDDLTFFTKSLNILAGIVKFVSVLQKEALEAADSTLGSGDGDEDDIYGGKKFDEKRLEEIRARKLAMEQGEEY